MSVAKHGARLPNNYLLRNCSVALVPCTKRRDCTEVIAGRVGELTMARFDVELCRFIAPPKVSRLGWKM